MARRKQRSVGGDYGAPWRERQPGGQLGPDYLPISPRTGRAVAQSTAERDHATEHGVVDSEGLWDSETERLMHGARRVPQTTPRYDAEVMAEFAARRGATLTAHEWEVYTLFWVQRMSYAAIARELSRNRDKVYATIKQLRVKRWNAEKGYR